MKNLLFSVLSLFVFSVYGKVDVSLEVKELLVNEAGSLKFVSDEGAISLTSAPNISGLRWGGTSNSSNTQIMNGKRTHTETVILSFSCSKEGTYVIPSFDFKVAGKPHKTGRHVVKVVKPQPIDNKLFVETAYNGSTQVPESIYAGEQIQYVIKVFVSSSIHHGAVLPQLTMNDVQFRDYSKYGRNYTNVAYTGKPESKLIKGNRFQVFTFVSEFTPLKSGEVSGDVKLSWQTVSENSRRTRDFFGRVRVEPTNYPLDFKLPKIKVLPLPSTGPSEATFLGLIGSWNCSLKLNKSKVPAGEAVNLVMDIKGHGNIDQLNIPELNLDGFRFYGEPEVKKEKDVNKTPGATVSWVIVPLSENSVLPTLKFSTFDTRSNKYREFSFSPKLIVTPGTATESSILIQGAGDTKISTKESLAAVDILFLKRDSLGLVTTPLEINVLWLVAPFLGAPFLLLVAFLIYRHKTQLDSSSDYRRQHSAVKSKKAVYTSVKKADDTQLTDVVLTSVVPWMNDVLGMPKGTSAQELAEKVEDKELSDMIIAAESSKYMSGAEFKIDRSKLLKKLSKFVCYLIVFVSFQNCFAAEYSEAGEAYESGDYMKAEKLFINRLTELDEQGVLDAALLYNLGNCAASQKKYGEALAWYEKARRVAPRDSDIIENRNFIWRQIESSELKSYEDAGPIELFNQQLQNLRPDEWLIVATIFWVLMFVCFGYNRIKRRGFPVGFAVNFILALFCVWSYFSVKSALYVPNGQAIVTGYASVYKIPVVNKERVSFSAEVGKYAQVIEERDLFCLVKIDQAEGWIEKSNLKFVWE